MGWNFGDTLEAVEPVLVADRPLWASNGKAEYGAAKACAEQSAGQGEAVSA